MWNSTRIRNNFPAEHENPPQEEPYSMYITDAYSQDIKLFDVLVSRSIETTNITLKIQFY